jgi:anti-sigma B factor antagonist
LPDADANLVVTTQADQAGPCLITVSGELDYHTGPQLRAQLDAAPCQSGLVLDLSGITYCDSTGVSVLVHAYRCTENAGTMLALAGAAPEVFRLLSLTGLDRFFRSYDSVDTAIHAFNS